MIFLAANRVFFRSIATVIGPTPPGTGVIKLAFFLTADGRNKVDIITFDSLKSYSKYTQLLKDKQSQIKNWKSSSEHLSICIKKCQTESL